MIKVVILDLDGTVYRGDEEVPGASAFVSKCHANGIKCRFVTNRSNRLPVTVRDHLRGYGIPCDDADVLTASQATARYLGSGSVHYIGEIGLRKPLEDAGLVINDVDPDFVVVGFDGEFSYKKLSKACTLIRNGAKFIATNPDLGLNLEGGIVPGTGALVAAVAAGASQEPVMIGKPETLLFEMVLEELGLGKEEALAVGDNLLTDIPAGERAGIKSVLLLTGISTAAEAAVAEYPPTWIFEGYEQLWNLICEKNGISG